MGKNKLLAKIPHLGIFFWSKNLKFASPCIINQFQYINQLDATISQVYY
jgi:hypothetical protein